MSFPLSPVDCHLFPPPSTLNPVSAWAVKQLWRSREHAKTGSVVAPRSRIKMSSTAKSGYGEGVAIDPALVCVKV
jgi:hypothetical protein